MTQKTSGLVSTWTSFYLAAEALCTETRPFVTSHAVFFTFRFPELSFQVGITASILIFKKEAGGLTAKTRRWWGVVCPLWFSDLLYLQGLSLELDEDPPTWYSKGKRTGNAHRVLCWREAHPLVYQEIVTRKCTLSPVLTGVPPRCTKKDRACILSAWADQRATHWVY